VNGVDPRCERTLEAAKAIYDTALRPSFHAEIFKPVHAQGKSDGEFRMIELIRTKKNAIGTHFVC
jgi:hypothetical protein